MMANLVFDQNDRLMVLAVHPDDESIAAGGVIQHAVAAGIDIKVVFITDGDNNPWPQRYLEKRLKITPADRFRWGRRRRKEAIAALSVLGLKTDQAVFLGFPDQGVTGLLLQGDTEVQKQIAALLEDWKPSILLVPALNDRHPDHNALAVVIDSMLANEQIDGDIKVLSYIVHGQMFLPSLSLELSPVQQLLKRVAILCHDTQMSLSRGRFLKHARRYEQFTDVCIDNLELGDNQLKFVERSEGKVYIKLKLSILDRLIKQPKLILVTDKKRLELNLTHVGQADVIDIELGAIQGRAMMKADWRYTQLTLPSDLLPQTETSYFKISHHWGLFDRSGWLRIKPRLIPCSLVKSVAVIPCFNVEDYCASVIIKSVELADRVIVVDDGSTDNTGHIISSLAHQYPQRIEIVKLAVNRGKGVALMAGFRRALERLEFESLITLDADGQHPPDFIPVLARKIAAGAHMVVGERDIRQMPGRSRLGNTLASGLLRWLYPSAPIDTQSGMRAFSREFAREIVNTVQGNRYETEFQILLLALTHHRSIASVVIPTIYLDNNRSSKFRPILDSMRIFGTLILWRLGFGPKMPV